MPCILIFIVAAYANLDAGLVLQIIGIEAVGALIRVGQASLAVLICALLRWLVALAIFNGMAAVEALGATGEGFTYSAGCRAHSAGSRTFMLVVSFGTVLYTATVIKEELREAGFTLIG